MSQDYSKQNILKHLNPAQRQAVTHNQGPLLIFAGAGSGKTRSITYKTAYLIQELKVSPESILLLTFTNKAADEMKSRVQKLVDQAPSFSSTFHSFAARLLRLHGPRLDLSRSFVIYDDDDQKKLITQIIKDLKLDSSTLKPNSVLATISQAKNELISATEYPQYAHGIFFQNVSKIYLEYQRRLKKAQALDFDDLLFMAVKLFTDHPDILEKYRCWRCLSIYLCLARSRLSQP
jgi:DNA helicase-2/ATP-dependent DNA helicase PcrA